MSRNTLTWGAFKDYESGKLKVRKSKQHANTFIIIHPDNSSSAVVTDEATIVKMYPPNHSK